MLDLKTEEVAVFDFGAAMLHAHRFVKSIKSRIIIFNQDYTGKVHYLFFIKLRLNFVADQF